MGHINASHGLMLQHICEAFLCVYTCGRQHAVIGHVGCYLCNFGDFTKCLKFYLQNPLNTSRSNPRNFFCMITRVSASHWELVVLLFKSSGTAACSAESVGRSLGPAVSLTQVNITDCWWGRNIRWEGTALYVFNSEKICYVVFMILHELDKNLPWDMSNLSSWVATR